MTRETSTISLRALDGQPLADRVVRDMVVAAAKALAERHGVDVIDVAALPDRVTCTLATSRIAAMGFAAELRRTTSAWYAHKFGGATLWGEARPEEAPSDPNADANAESSADADPDADSGADDFPGSSADPPGDRPE